MSCQDFISLSPLVLSTKRMLCLGQLASDEDRFCPFAAIAKYPYRYFYQDRDAQKIVAERFWDGGQFIERGWSIFYIRTLSDTSLGSLLLIPKTEVQAFFKEIMGKTGFHLPFPDATTTPGFDIGFQMEGEPRPRYLGRLTSNIGLPDLQNLIPAEGKAPEEPLALDDRSFAGFRRKMESAILAGKNSNRAQKEQKKRERIVRKGRWCSQLKRTQCYLGLRPKVTAKFEDFDLDPNATWEESRGAEEAYKLAAGITLPPLDLRKPAPYIFNLNVVFVCVDIEVCERDSRKLTEVGISTLDTASLTSIPPGEAGIEWMNQMRCRHFRVADYAHIVNKRYVTGCPDKFMPNFGSSEWISVNEVPQVVAACFRPPYSMPGHYTPHPTKMSSCPRFGSKIQPLVNPGDWPKRNVILVGHEIRSDISYLRSIGYDVSNLGNLLEAIDTIDLWRAWKHEQQAPKLGNVLLELGLTGWHLHNAGNDAAYTLQALIGIALAALEPAKEYPASAPAEHLDEAALDARQRLVEEKDEWANADEEGGDGGEARTISQVEFDQSMSKGRKADERATHRSRSQTYPTKGGQTFGPSKASKSKNSHNSRTEQKNNTSAKAADHVLPHLRGLPKPMEAASKSQRPGVPRSLADQMQKRLVIMEDEEYGM